ncbi:hypothetical protein DdX_19714 [Ditylenchus destructor]|uniref:Uncharacterized protein n=1 Tax=Ditylenchus destructor TaxID=166010 RepID=A0AAD4QS69_9BILA|nr:hypothetical protein DdX_19714 [Ditylenchus destructor]
MFAINQKFVDILKCNVGSIDKEPRYIRCESLTLKGWPELYTVHLPDLLKWLTRNVRAESLNISFILNRSRFLPLAKFLLNPSGAKKCTSSKIKIKVSNPVVFLTVLIQKFRAISLVKDDVPTIELLYPSFDAEWERLGSNLIDQEADPHDAKALYMISNGQNRMRISLCASNTPNWNDCEIRIYSI